MTTRTKVDPNLNNVGSLKRAVRLKDEEITTLKERIEFLQDGDTRYEKMLQLQDDLATAQRQLQFWQLRANEHKDRAKAYLDQIRRMRNDEA